MTTDIRPQVGYRQYLHTTKYKVINVVRMIQSTAAVQKEVGSVKRKLYKGRAFEMVGEEQIGRVQARMVESVCIGARKHAE